MRMPFVVYQRRPSECARRTSPPKRRKSSAKTHRQSRKRSSKHERILILLAELYDLVRPSQTSESAVLRRTNQANLAAVTAPLRDLAPAEAFIAAHPIAKA